MTFPWKVTTVLGLLDFGAGFRLSPKVSDRTPSSEYSTKHLAEQVNEEANIMQPFRVRTRSSEHKTSRRASQRRSEYYAAVPGADSDELGVDYKVSRRAS